MARGRGRKPTATTRKGAKHPREAAKTRRTTTEVAREGEETVPQSATLQETGVADNEPLGRAEVASMIGEAMKTAVSQISEEIQRGRSPAMRGEGAPWESGSVSGMELDAGGANNPTPPPTGESPPTTKTSVSASLRQKILTHKYVDLKLLLSTNEKPRSIGHKSFRPLSYWNKIDKTKSHVLIRN